MDIKTKILIPAIAITLLVAVAILSSNIMLFSGFVGETTLNRVDADAAEDIIWAFINRGIIITVIILAIFIAVILIVVRRIVTPIRAMTEAAAALAAGDIDIDLQVDTKDEMRTLADAFNSMVQNTRQQVRIVEHIANGDLTVSLQPRSDKDIMNYALGKLNETIRAQAVSIREEHERIKLMLDATPLASRLWNREFELIECNQAAVELFKLKDKQEYLDRYLELTPKYQSDGQKTIDKIIMGVAETFEKGKCTYEVTYCMLDGTPVPAENTLVRVPYGNDYVVAAYSRDLREQQKMMADIEHRDNLLNTGHRISYILFDKADDKDIGAVLTESMELLGECVGADQAYITQNETVDGILYFTCKYAWVSDAGAAILPGMRFPYGRDFEWDNRFLQGECINGPVKDLPPAIQDFFAPFATRSALVIPVFVQDKFWGLVGFSDCKKERSFGDDEVNILRSMSLMMAAAIGRNEQAAGIREAHNRTRLLTNATPLGFNLWDRNFHNIDTNDTAVTLFGLKNHDEYLARFFELSPQYQPDGCPSEEKAAELLDIAFAKGYCQFEWLHQKPDGTPVPMEITLVRLAYGDDYVVAGYMRDLREQKKITAETIRLQTELTTALKDAQDANHAKSSFIASMSHEIRTPLNAIVGLSELIIDNDYLDTDTKGRLEKIHTSGMTILSIVNDILDISKIESGKFEIYPVQYDTPSLINDILTLNIVRTAEKNIAFKLYVDENLPGALYGDDLRVKQIFNNLLSNAFKYTNSGTVEWRVSFERDVDAVWIISSVRDTGIGIKEQDMQKLFSDYNQVDKTTNRKVEGTGLGLAIAKRLVEMMDGVITVESEYGKGTTFNVRLRQILVSDTPVGKEVADNLMGLRYTLSKRAKNTKLARVDLSYAHVLVVDDIEINIDVVKGMMRPYGMKIDCATSGRQAIEMIRAGNPHYNAVFMDHMMPEMDGIEAARLIREEIGTDYARDIPIIALTANAIVGNEAMFLSHGFQAFISKPIDMMKLDVVLRRWVRDKNMEKERLDKSGDGPLPGENNSNTDSEESLLKNVTIGDIDKYRALERFNGNEKVFIGILRSYAANTRSLLNNLRESLAAENFKEYNIIIHGIKGSSYGIAARKTGRTAEMLELAAETGDASTIKAGHAVFEKIARVLLDDIDKALAEIDAANQKPVAAAPDPALLEALRKACRAFDMDGVDETMAKLEYFRYESGGNIVEWLRKQIDDMNFEKVFSGEWPPG